MIIRTSSLTVFALAAVLAGLAGLAGLVALGLPSPASSPARSAPAR